MTVQRKASIIETRCIQLQHEWKQFTHILLAMSGYMLLKTFFLTTGWEVMYVAELWHNDLLAIVLVAVFGYGLVSLGMGYIRIGAAIQDFETEYSVEELQRVAAVPFLHRFGDSYTVGSLLLGTGISTNLFSIVLFSQYYV